MSIKKNKTEKANPPITKVRVGLVSASVWENATEKGTHYSVTFDRRYRDDQGDWHSTNNYGVRDLLALAKCADLAHTKIVQALGDDNDAE